MKTTKLLALISVAAMSSDFRRVQQGMANKTTLETTQTTVAAENENAANNTIVDLNGNEIALPEQLDKLVSIMPSNTEMLVALGLAEKIVAADMYSYDAGVSSEICTIDSMNINLELIIAIEPDGNSKWYEYGGGR